MSSIDGGGPTPAEQGISENVQGKKAASSPAKEPAKELTPADRAVNKALKGIDDTHQDFLSAGVTEDQIQAAKAKAEDRIRSEFKELEAKDPLTIVETALEDSAKTEDERKLVDFNMNTLEWQRSLLSRGIPKLRDMEGLPQYRVNEVVRDMAHDIEWKIGQDGTATAHAIISIFRSIERQKEGGTYEETELVTGVEKEQYERLLRNLGVLEEGESAFDLYQKVNRGYDSERQGNQSQPTPTEPYRIVKDGRETSWATGFPTKIEGVEARIKPYFEISVTVSPQALQRIKSFGKT